MENIENITTDEKIRIQKYFTDCGVLSRRAAEAEIEAGHVRINGEIATIGQKITLGRMDLSQGNLIDTAQSLSKIKTHYQNWHKIAIPLLVVWFAWLMYEMTNVLGVNSSMAIGFCCGAAVGGIIGGVIGFRINRKIVRKACEILEQIKELQKES